MSNKMYKFLPILPDALAGEAAPATRSTRFGGVGCASSLVANVTFTLRVFSSTK